jgi:glycosyltransferase involved in cell wall biosynthesis
MNTVIHAFKQTTFDVAVKLLIIGEGPEREALSQLINGDDRILLLGFQEKEAVPYLFVLADIFIFASNYDGWGLVINEAMTAGNAIICSKSVGAASDLLRHNENAILCDAGAVDQFSESLAQLITRPQLRCALSASAQTNAEPISSYNIAQKIYAIYEMGK